MYISLVLTLAIEAVPTVEADARVLVLLVQTVSLHTGIARAFVDVNLKYTSTYFLNVHKYNHHHDCNMCLLLTVTERPVPSGIASTVVLVDKIVACSIVAR